MNENNPLVNLTKSVLGVSSNWVSYMTNGSGNPFYAFIGLWIVIMVLNICIGFWFPTFNKKYTQASPSTFAINLTSYVAAISGLVSIIGPLYLYGSSLFYAGYHLPNNFPAVLYSLWKVASLHILFGLISFLSSAFTKFDYNAGNQISTFYYCTNNAASGNILVANPATCQRTKGQTFRDAILSSIDTYAQGLRIGINSLPFVPFIILAGIIMSALSPP
jgi:hypothetical protein